MTGPAVGVEQFDVAADLVRLGRRMVEYGATVIRGEASPAEAVELAERMQQLADMMRTPVPDEGAPDPRLAEAARQVTDGLVGPTSTA